MSRRETLYRFLEDMEIAEPTRPVPCRASHPQLIRPGTLDAIHPATAMFWRVSATSDLVLATHDAVLGLAERASGFRVAGKSP